MTDWKQEKAFHRGINAVFGILYALVIAKGLEVMGGNIPTFSLTANVNDLAAATFFTVFMILLALEITRAHETGEYYTEGRGKYGSFAIYLLWMLQYALHYGFINSVGSLSVEVTLPRYMAMVMGSYCLYIAVDATIMRMNPFKRQHGYSHRLIYYVGFYALSALVFCSNDILEMLNLRNDYPVWLLAFPWVAVYVAATRATFGD